jgi:hypothetical protein
MYLSRLPGTCTMQELRGTYGTKYESDLRHHDPQMSVIPSPHKGDHRYVPKENMIAVVRQMIALYDEAKRHYKNNPRATIGWQALITNQRVEATVTPASTAVLFQPESLTTPFEDFLKFKAVAHYPTDAYHSGALYDKNRPSYFIRSMICVTAPIGTDDSEYFTEFLPNLLKELQAKAITLKEHKGLCNPPQLFSEVPKKPKVTKKAPF